MQPERWQRVQELFHRAADLPRSEQLSFLSQACGDDSEIRSTVLAMIEQDSKSFGLLDRDVSDLAADLIQADTTQPREFGPYRIKSVLGEGGMGVVYLAERRDLGNLVAIKILRDAWLSPSRLKRFETERRTLAQLNHPFIAPLYDAATLPDGTPWFAMEYVQGLALNKYCEVHRCSIEDRLKLVRSVCEAVQYAHERGVIHRDLKPSNILVKEDGALRLLDFGIAKQLDTDGRPADQTRTDLRPMTPAYAAPEQLRGGAAGVESDVYSLGVILYELLTGRLPFDVSQKTPPEAAAVRNDTGTDEAVAGGSPRRNAHWIVDRFGCAVPEGDAERSRAPISICAGADRRPQSLFKTRAAQRPPRFAVIHVGEISAAKLAIRGNRSGDAGEHRDRHRADHEPRSQGNQRVRAAHRGGDSLCRMREATRGSISSNGGWPMKFPPPWDMRVR